MNVYNGQLKRYKNGVTLFHETLREIYDMDYMHVLCVQTGYVCMVSLQWTHMSRRGNEQMWVVCAIRLWDCDAPYTMTLSLEECSWAV